MSNTQMHARDEPGLYLAWARSFLTLTSPPARELSPFLVSITGYSDGVAAEDADLRHALDACLEECGCQTVEKVAKSIFPAVIWRRANGDRQKLYRDYLTYLPDYVAMEPTKNCRGIYFARLIGYGTQAKTGGQESHLPNNLLKEGGNQLEFVIKACKPGAQRMALQATIYDPVRDQSAGRRSFPCLQHISFAPDFQRKTLALNAFYATQQLFVKAYGNWLGLGRLGAFVASQTGLQFERLNCYAGIQKMDADGVPRAGDLLDRLTDLARACVARHESGSAEADRG